MKKIPTVFVRDWDGTIGPPARFVLDEPHPDCGWVFAGEGVATRKYDGTCCLVRDGKLYRRQEVKPGKATPPDFETVDTDPETGKVVGWVPVGDGPEDQWHRAAWADFDGDQFPPLDGTYELVGPKVQGGADAEVPIHLLVRHADASHLDAPRSYDALKAWLAGQDIEGVVWHHPDGRMAKIKGKDFGLPRVKANAS